MARIRLFHVAAILLLFSFSAIAWTQKRAIPLSDSYVRVWAIDRIVQDPKSGLRMPSHATRPGILGYTCVYAKDGRHAFCEFVAKSYADHQPLRDDVNAKTDAQMSVFEKGSSKLEDVETAAHKAGFTDIDLKRMKVGVR